MAEALYQRDLTKAAANKEGAHILFGIWIPSFFAVYFPPEATSLTERVRGCFHLLPARFKTVVCI